MNSRIVVLLIGFFIAWSLLIARAVQLQIVPDEKLANLQKRQYRSTVELPARRGSILDRNGYEFAIAVPTYSVFADPFLIEDPREVLMELQRVFTFTRDGLSDRLKNRNRRFVWVERHLTKEMADEIRALRIRGIGLIEETKRVYPSQELMGQVLGITGSEGQGLEGLELYYDETLKGENRQYQVGRDARGRPLLAEGRIFSERPAGKDIELTIDSELQYMLETTLVEAVHKHEADSAVGVILDARTSEVLAIANAPTFNPNSPGQSPRKQWRNRAITDAFEPGSTIKSLVIAGALEKGSVVPNKKYHGEQGRFRIGRRVIREAESRHRHEELTVSEILSLSSNIGTAKIALELGDESVREILSSFGIGEALGLGFPGEAAGVLHSLPWRDHLLANISFGHGMTATPLQIASAYAVIANGGVLKRPRLVRAYVNPENGERTEVEEEKIRRVLAPETASTMMLMLTQATDRRATGFNARVAGFPVAGKTGTAQKVRPEGGYSREFYISSFAGFLPSHDPRFVIYIAVDSPRDKFYGSEVAAPLFSKVGGYAVRKAGLSPVILSEKNIVPLKEENIQGPAIRRIQSMVETMKMEEAALTPNLIGLSLREVYTHLRGTSLRVDVEGRGVVSSMTPSPGEPLPEEGAIRVKLEL